MPTTQPRKAVTTMPDKKLTNVTDTNVGKMTDSEIVKALECCIGIVGGKCYECPYKDIHGCEGKLIKNTLDLINRQKAENEKLQDLMVKNDAMIAKQEVEIERLNAVVDKADAEVGVLLEKLNATIAGQETLQKYIAEKNAEIEKLKSGKNVFLFAENTKNEIKAEAYKEFAERLKERREIVGYDRDLELDIYGSHIHIDIDEFNNILKELVGDDK